MSTLTSSPSTSPRNPFHHPSPRSAYATAGPSTSSTSNTNNNHHHNPRSPATTRHSPRAFSTHASRRSLDAQSAAAAPQQPEKQQLPHAAPAVGAYVSTGTQYSPDGFPPTAGPKLAGAAAGKPPGAATGSHSGRKRKETVSPDSSPEPMSSASAASGAPHGAQRMPDEPSVRSDPAQAGSRGDSSIPQEARSTHGHSAAPKRSRADPALLKIMPLRYEKANTKELGMLVANMLMELIRINDQIPLRDGRLTRFHSRAPPGISVSDYLQRLIQHATLSPPILLSMVYYIDRLCTMYPAFTINSLTVHRFLITAATVAAKGLSDSFWTNPTYARIGGIPVSELATLELELLQRVDWKIVPRPETLEDYYRSLVDRTEGFVLESGSSGSDSCSSIPDSETGKSENEEMSEGNT